jgi:hypothetical protein
MSTRGLGEISYYEPCYFKVDQNEFKEFVSKNNEFSLHYQNPQGLWRKISDFQNSSGIGIHWDPQIENIIYNPPKGLTYSNQIRNRYDPYLIIYDSIYAQDFYHYVIIIYFLFVISITVILCIVSSVFLLTGTICCCTIKKKSNEYHTLLETEKKEFIEKKDEMNSLNFHQNNV